MNSFQIFRQALDKGHPPEELFEKPVKPSPPLDSAVWRFLNSWRMNETLTADEAVLFRQVIRWGDLNGSIVNPNHMDEKFQLHLARSGVSVDAARRVTASKRHALFIRDLLDGALAP